MSITLALSSFIAGIITILAPCVLPILPVIIGSTAGSKDSRKPLIVTVSLGISIVLFTLLLKVSTLFINVPQAFWTGLSGGIVLVFGVFLLFPNFWDAISSKLGFDKNSHDLLQNAGDKDSIFGAILIGAALGPVFSSCSPTYFIILATVLSVNFFTGVIYLVIYTFGLILTLALIAYFGQKAIKQLKWAANPNGIFKKTMGLLLILVGLGVMTGYSKVIETKILASGYNPSALEQKLTGDNKTSNSNSVTNSTLDSTSKLINSEKDSKKYQDYSQENVLRAQKNNKHYAYFFHADWCSTCHALEKIILSNINNLPNKSVIFKVDFDKEDELKKEFNVFSQTTVIFFDSEGRVIDRKINPSLDRIVQGLSGHAKVLTNNIQNTTIDTVLNKIKDKKKSFKTSREYFAFLEKQQSLQQATFAGGCFWCMEGPFEDEKGVVETFNGYVGGNVIKPSYEQVSSGKTGARESVDVFYNPELISYEKLLETYWRQIDPTDAGGQFADRGSQYMTAIFYRNEQQKTAALKSKKELEDSGKFSKIATEILPLSKFYLAEEYHQDYYKKSAKQYHSYKSGSGRQENIEKNSKEFDKIFNNSSSYIKPKNTEIKAKLSSQSYAVTQEGETEKPFDNAYWDNHEPGIYVDIVTGEPLFSSTDKFDSNTGWPSFTRPIDDNFIKESQDNKMSIPRTEIQSKIGKSHLGHLFNDGPKDKGGMRYCINSAALRFIPLAKMKEEGYGKYLSLFGSDAIKD